VPGREQQNGAGNSSDNSAISSRLLTIDAVVVMIIGKCISYEAPEPGK
jgi:hypothetical protein